MSCFLPGWGCFLSGGLFLRGGVASCVMAYFVGVVFSEGVFFEVCFFLGLCFRRGVFSRFFWEERGVLQVNFQGLQ